MTSQEEEIVKNQLKKLFYTGLSNYELINILNLSKNKYNKLLGEIKKEYGLQTNYRRVPSKIEKYGKNKYYVGHIIDENNFEILSYAPTKEYAENSMELYKKDNINDEYFIGQATDEEILKLIEKDYFEKEQTWNTIIVKYKLGYHVFYEFLNKIKKNKGLNDVRTGKHTRYIYPFSNRWRVRKRMNGKLIEYGYYDDINTAILIRDYLESINWDYDLWKKNKKQIIEDISK